MRRAPVPVWDRPRSIGAALDRTARPLAFLVRFLGTSVTQPAMPELRVQPILIGVLTLALLGIVLLVPVRAATFAVAALVLPEMWAGGGSPCVWPVRAPFRTSGSAISDLPPLSGPD